MPRLLREFRVFFAPPPKILGSGSTHPIEPLPSSKSLDPFHLHRVLFALCSCFLARVSNALGRVVVRTDRWIRGLE